jgi:L-Ala-D/L-Glu epimerase
VRVGSDRVTGLRLGLRWPLRGQHHREIVRLSLWGEGEVGQGEAAPLAGFTREDAAMAYLALERVQLVRDWPEDAAGIAAEVTALGLPPTAACAVETALLDLLGRVRGVPVARLLAHDALGQVPVSRLCSDLASAVQALADGIGTIKIKVGEGSWQDDLLRVRLIRQALGSGVRLRLDANQRWSPEVARQALDDLAALGVEAIEEPVAGGDLALLAGLRGLGTPIALDETVRSAADLDRALGAGAGDAVVLKPMFIGGLWSAMAVGRKAAAAGMVVWMSTAIDGAVGQRAALHAAAALGGTVAHGLDTAAWIVGDALLPPAIAGGRAMVEGPGLGLAPPSVR